MITKKGTITSAKSKKTVMVTVNWYVKHPIYKKRFRKSRKFMADTGGMQVNEGDYVLIKQCRPLSKNKHFIVEEVLKKAPQQEEIAIEKEVEEVLATKEKSEESSLSEMAENEKDKEPVKNKKEEEIKNSDISLTKPE